MDSTKSQDAVNSSATPDSAPLVTIFLNTKDRPAELAVTLEDLHRQTYPNIEVLVTDDGSTPPIAPIVHASWPNARVIRHDVAVNLAACRNEGIPAASGEFVLQIDDDSSPVAPDAITRAVAYLQAAPDAALLSFHIWNGEVLPADLDLSKATAGLCHSFVGCGVMYRQSAILQTDGFRGHYLGHGEEEELSAQLLRAGWSQIYQPDLLIHHRYSPVNRDNSEAWKRNFRNLVWTSFSFMPLRRLPFEVGWRFVNATIDAVRLLRIRKYFRALFEIVMGLPRALRLRQPLDKLALRRYDILAAKRVITREEFDNPPDEFWRNLAVKAKRWPNRLREAPFWSKKKSLGRGDVPTHEHELQ